MQRPNIALDSFTESTIDQGIALNGTGTGQQGSLNNILNQVETRLSSSATSSGEALRINSITHDIDNFSSWCVGESSSRPDFENQVNQDGTKMEERWSSSLHDNDVIEPTNIRFPGRLDIGSSSSEIVHRPFHLPLGSDHVETNLNQHARYVVDNGRHTGAFLMPNSFNSGGLEIGQASSSHSSSDVGTSSGCSGYLLEETNVGSGHSVDGWGLSCKRKALEGTSGHSYAGASSSSSPQAENGSWHITPSPNPSSNSSFSTPLQSSPVVVSHPERINPRISFGPTGSASDSFSSGISGNAEPPRNIGRRGNPRQQQESLTFNLSTPGSSRHSNIWQTHLSHGPLSFIGSDDSQSMATAASSSGAAQGLHHAMRVPAIPRDMHPFPWNGSSDSRNGNPSSSRAPRNSAEHLLFVSATEMRNMTHDPTGQTLASNAPVRVDPSSSVHSMPNPSWIPHHNPSTNNQQRFLEFAPWSLFPSVDSETGGQSGHSAPLSSGLQTTQETVIPPGSMRQGQNQQFPRSGLMTERDGVLRMPRALRALAADIEGRNRQGDDVLGMPRSLRALAADIEGRHRLITEIRQVLHAMRRGEHVQIEDYMLLDPVYYTMAEIHDRHREMRLDVDNMSYEELLALEERIGDVSTGLSEETILKLMKQQTYVSFTGESMEDLEPCCICQEEYVDGDDLGKLDCGHDFHAECIKQWLMQKNVCPICKTTALPTT